MFLCCLVVATATTPSGGRNELAAACFCAAVLTSSKIVWAACLVGRDGYGTTAYIHICFHHGDEHVPSTMSFIFVDYFEVVFSVVCFRSGRLDLMSVSAKGVFSILNEDMLNPHVDFTYSNMRTIYKHLYINTRMLLKGPGCYCV